MPPALCRPRYDGRGMQKKDVPKPSQLTDEEQVLVADG
jgi:hypothetical protein